jgi:hypothetical protein
MAGSKRVIFNVRVSEQVAEAIDQARAGQSRSAWVADAIDRMLTGDPEPAVEQKKQVRDPDRCPHPRARVIKGFCYRCGMPAAT